MNIITLRDLSYQKVKNKLSKIAAKDQLKEEKKMKMVMLPMLLNQKARVKRSKERLRPLRSISSLRRTLVR